MKEMILAVVGFHWLATLSVGAAIALDAVRRPMRRDATWTFPTQVVHTIHSVLERQDAQSEPCYSRAA